MKTFIKKRITPWLLSAALIAGMTGAPAYATETNPYAGGLCEHHTEHTADCGYSDGAPCTHEHTEDCYREMETCVHKHTAECYPEADDTDAEATPSNTKAEEPTECPHMCSEESGCIINVPDCPHNQSNHDDNCGYIEGTHCEYICEICANADNPTGGNKTAPEDTMIRKITAWEWIDEDEYLTDGRLSMPGVSTDHQADFDTVVSMLPKKINAAIEGAEEPEELTLTRWTCAEYGQDAAGNWPITGEYTFAAALPEGYALSDPADAPEVSVLLGGGITYSQSTGAFIVTGGTPDIDYSYTDGTLTIKSGADVTIANDNPDISTTDKIVVQNGAKNVRITLAGVNIDGTQPKVCAFNMDGAQVDLILADSTKNILKSGSSAGLQVTGNAALTIDGNGELEIKSSNLNSNSAGIGGNFYGTCGTITINGGIITATAINGAGIGGGEQGRGGTIIINGGTIKATSTGPTGGAGIGGGNSDANNISTITINGGTITAVGYSGAGIGGGTHNPGNNIRINGGTIKASSTDGAGIGSGNGDVSGGAVTITGGTITATSAKGAGIGGSHGGGAGIGGGDWNGGAGTFSTGDTGGNAFITASSIQDKSNSDSWSGVIFQGNDGKVYGTAVTLSADAEISSGRTLTVEAGKTLTIDSGVTLTNHGTIDNLGIINCYGTITPNPPNGNGTVNGESTTTVTLLNSDGERVTAIPYGSDITIKATAQGKAQNLRSRSAADKYVNFYLGTAADGTTLGTVQAASNGDTFSAEITATVSGDTWKIGENTITAEFGGASAQNLLDSTGTAALDVTRLNQTAETVVAGPDTVMLVSGDVPVITPVQVQENAEVIYSAVSNTTGKDDTSDVATISGTTIRLLKAGTFYVKAVIAQTDHYAAKTIYSGIITVTKEDSTFTVTTKNGDDVTGSFTYGDTITVEVSGIQARTQSRSRAMEFDNVYLFAADPGENPDIADAIASAPVNGDTAALTYDTTGKGIPAGTLTTLYVVYGGSDGLNSSVNTADITLEQKTLTGAVVSSAGKIYDGTAGFTGVGLDLTGKVSGDDVTATADGTVSDAGAGADKIFTADKTTLGGIDADYYSLAAGDVSGNVSINKKALADTMIGAIPDQSYTGSAIEPALTVTDGEPNIISANDYEISYTNNTGAGTAAATITAAENGNYSGSASKNFTIVRAQQGVLAITGMPDGDITYGQEFTLSTAGGTGGGAVTWQVTGPAVVEENTGKVSITGVGEVTVTAAKAGGDNYQDAQAAETFTTVKAQQDAFTITGKPDGEIVYGQEFTLGAAGGSGNGTVTWAVTSGAAVVDASTGAVKITGIGNVIITASKAGGDNYQDVQASETFTAVKAQQGALAITGMPDGDIVYGQEFTLDTSGGSSDGAVTWNVTGPATAGETTGKISITGVGEVTVTAVKAGGDNYLDATADETFTTVKAQQSMLAITGKPDGDIVYGQEFTLGTSGGSGDGAITWTVTGGAAVVDINTGAVKVTGVGDVAITAVKAGGSNYQDITATETFTTVKAQQSVLSITGKPDGDIVYGQEFTLDTAGGSGGGAVTWTAAGPATIDSRTGAVKITGVGDVTITAVKAGGSNYQDATATYTFTIGKADQKDFSIVPVTGKKYGDASFTLETTGGNGGGAVSYSVPDENGVLSISEDTAAIVGAGSVTVTAVKAGNDNYNSVTATLEIIIDKADQTDFSITPVTGKKYGDVSFTLETTGGNGDGAVTYSVPDHNGVLSVSGDTAAIVGAGSVIVTAVKAGSKNYNSTSATLEITIDKADQTNFSINAVTGKKYGDAPFQLTVTGGAGNGAVSYSVPDHNGVLAVSGDTAAIIGAGTVTVMAVKAADTNYNSTSAALEITIDKADQTGFSIHAVTGKRYGDAFFKFETAGGGGDGAITYSAPENNGVLTISGDTAAIVGAGTVTVTATKAASTNYNSVTATTEITIDKADETGFSIHAVTGKRYGDASFTLKTTDGGGDGAITYSVPENNGVLTINGDIAAIAGAGTVTVTATKAASANYNRVTATVEITIDKADQTGFSINMVTGKKYGDDPFTLETTGNDADGAITYSVPENNGVLTVSGDTAAIIGAGSVTVTAVNAGNENYNSAAAALEITIGRAEAPVITYPAADSLTYGQKLSESTLTGGSTVYGTFAWENGNTVPTVENTGYAVIFNANEDTMKNYAPVANPSESVMISVSKAAPAINVSADFSDKAGSRQAVLTASVDKTGGGLLPTGMVKFINSTEDTDEDITGAAAVTVIDGAAVYTWTGLSEQIYKVKAVYSGDSNYQTVISSETSFDARRPVYEVTVTNGTADKTQASEGDTITVTSEDRSGYTFTGWSSADVTFADSSAKITTFTMPAKAVSVTANYSQNGSNDSSSDSNSGSDDSSSDSNSGSDGSSSNSNSGSIGSGGSGGSGGSSSGGGKSSDSGYKDTYQIAEGAASAGISRNSLQGLADTGKNLTVSDSRMALTFDTATLKSILSATADASDGTVTFSVTSADVSRFADAKALIGSRPALDFTIIYQKNGQTVTAPVDLGSGKVSVAIKYQPASTEATGGLYAAYVDKDGNTVLLDNSSYDRNRNEVIFSTNHFSIYGVAYKAPAPAFNDTANHWAKDDIDFAAARGLLSGTGNNQFSPDSAITQDMFVTALGRLTGVNPAGTGDKRFTPDAPMTREQMAVIMADYAGQMGYSIPAPLTVAEFTDSSRISEWAVKEVRAMQQAGIIKGKDGNHFDPQANATRAEVSAALRRFMEILIDPATVNGWKKNDSGHWLCYKDGKILTGWQTVDGRWYYFNPDGTMAVNKKIDGYEVGPDGARLSSR